MEKIRVLVSGASGRMGREVVKAVIKDPDLELVAAVDKMHLGQDIGLSIGQEELGIKVQADLQRALQQDKPKVMVDFSTPMTVMENIRLAGTAKVNAVVGTTGFSQADLTEVADLTKKQGFNVLVAPNFAIGALLMMQFSKIAAQYFPNVEIIELHHDQKLDAPSGTSIKTAEMIMEGRQETDQQNIGEEKIKGVRGGEMGGIHLHSVRLPGLIAHQESWSTET